MTTSAIVSLPRTERANMAFPILSAKKTPPAAASAIVYPSLMNLLAGTETHPCSRCTRTMTMSLRLMCHSPILSIA
jgi:hypothetical protein